MNRRRHYRDAMRVARQAGGMSSPEYAILDVMIQESDPSAGPIRRYRKTIAARLSRTARTVTALTSRLEARGWIKKKIRKIRTAAGQIMTLATEYTFCIPDEWSRAVTRPDTRTTPRPPVPSSTAAGSVLVGVPPVRSARPAGPPTSAELAFAAFMDRARAP